MKIRFKSKEARGEFMNLNHANWVMAEMLGMNWWPAKNTLNDGTIEIVTPEKECILVDGYYAFIFMKERKYFDIVV